MSSQKSLRLYLVMNLKKSFKLLSICLLAMSSIQNSTAQPKTVIESIQTPVIPTDLEKEIKLNRHKVDLFEKVRIKAEQMGLRVWIMGGAAASFAHYVRWDMLLRAGDTNFIGERFDYFYHQFIRESQDIDFVVDGDPSRADQLKKYIQSIAPKKRIDIATLKHSTPRHPELLGFDFQNQDSDSHSLGLVELTDPKDPSISVIQDLDHFERAGSNRFLEDVANARVSFVRKATHSQTSRFKEHKNPEIFAVIRLIIKMGQLDLLIPDSSNKEIRDIIHHSNFSVDLGSDYSKSWLKKNAPKLLLQSSNYFRVKRILEDLGLMHRLLALADEDLEALFSRDAVHSAPLGQKGETAKSLGIKELTHATDSFEAFDSLVGMPVVRVNALLSRRNFSKERAIHGAGFYAEKGHLAKSSYGKFILYLELKEDAKLGVDFTINSSGTLQILNAEAIRLVGYRTKGSDLPAALVSGPQNSSGSAALSTHSTGFIPRGPLPRSYPRATPPAFQYSNPSVPTPTYLMARKFTMIGVPIAIAGMSVFGAFQLFDAMTDRSAVNARAQQTSSFLMESKDPSEALAQWKNQDDHKLSEWNTARAKAKAIVEFKKNGGADHFLSLNPSSVQLNEATSPEGFMAYGTHVRDYILKRVLIDKVADEEAEPFLKLLLAHEDGNVDAIRALYATYHTGEKTSIGTKLKKAKLSAEILMNSPLCKDLLSKIKAKVTGDSKPEGP